MPIVLHDFDLIVFFSSCLNSPDITRACLLDESQGRFFADVLPVILKEIGKKKAKEMFPVSKEYNIFNFLINFYSDFFLIKF